MALQPLAQYSTTDPNSNPFTEGSISLLSCFSAFDTGINIRDGSSCVVCCMEVEDCLDHCHIVDRNETRTWDILKAKGWVPQKAKSCMHECRNGLLLCKNHHAAFDHYQFFIRFVPERIQYVFVNFQEHKDFREFHDNPVRLYHNDPRVPFPSLFFFHEIRCLAQNPSLHIPEITVPDPKPPSDGDLGHEHGGDPGMPRGSEDRSSGNSDNHGNDNPRSQPRDYLSSTPQYSRQRQGYGQDYLKPPESRVPLGQRSARNSPDATPPSSNNYHESPSTSLSSRPHPNTPAIVFPTSGSSSIVSSSSKISDEETIGRVSAQLNSVKNDCNVAQPWKKIKLPMIRDPTDVFSQSRLEALGFRNFKDLEPVEIDKAEWGGSTEENIKKWRMAH